MTTEALPPKNLPIIPLEEARRLFEEARVFHCGDTQIPEDSKIIRLAERVFGRPKVGVRHITFICTEIFFVLACESQGVLR